MSQVVSAEFNASGMPMGRFARFPAVSLAWRTPFVACLLFVYFAVATPAMATVEVNVTQAGFPTLTRGDVVRAGAWVPVVVDLALVDQAVFDGTLRIGQFDVDGDECFDSIEAHLRADAGSSARYHLFVPANPVRNQHRFVVEVFDEQGEAVEVVSQGVLTFQARPAQSPTVINDDEILVLSLSEGAVGHVADLRGAEEVDRFRRQVYVAHMHPSLLPELWLGLESVDFVVWDDARPEELTERQVKALVEWVRQGGTLFLTASRTAGSLDLSEALSAVMPVDLGELKPVDNLPLLRRALFGSDEERSLALSSGKPDQWDDFFPSRIPVVPCTLHADAQAVVETDGEDLLMARARVGRGHVIFSGVTLVDLFTGGGSGADLFARVFHLSTVPEDEARPSFVSLFPHVVSAVGFADWGVSYLLVAGVFSLVYVLTATFGTWRLLGVRGWRQHSWSAFAVVAVVASLLSVVAVNFVRGLGRETMHQISIVDVDLGQSYGYATVYFGLKTGIDKELDLWLPSDRLGAGDPLPDRCFLRPLSPSGNPLSPSGSFADPEAYRLVPASAVMSGVRFRATLKRFEGRWQGPIGGTVEGEIAVKRGTVEAGSYLINRLGVDLVDCYLLHPALALNATNDPRSRAIYAYQIDRLPAGERVDLFPICNPPRRDDDGNPVQMRSRLGDAHGVWRNEFMSLLSRNLGTLIDAGADLGQEKQALLLLSTIGDYDPQDFAGMGSSLLGFSTFSRDRLRHLDLRDQLSPDTMVLIGFANDPGPCRLFRRSGEGAYRALEPVAEKTWTMYRIHIPVTRIVSDEPEEEEEVR